MREIVPGSFDEAMLDLRLAWGMFRYQFVSEVSRRARVDRLIAWLARLADGRR